MADIHFIGGRDRSFIKGQSGGVEGGGGGGHDGSMEARVAILEALIPTLATKGDVSELRAEMHGGFADVVKWVIGTAIVAGGLGLTIMAFVLNNAVPKAPSAQPTLAPIVIQVPAPQGSGFEKAQIPAEQPKK
jgi:hypothetical protein